jgi:hypothetical protein
MDAFNELRNMTKKSMDMQASNQQALLHADDC